MLGRVHSHDPRAEFFPDRFDFAEWFLGRRLDRRDDDHTIAEQIADGCGGAVLLTPGERVAADERHVARQRGLSKLCDDRALRAADVGDERPRLAHGGGGPDVVDDPSDGGADDDQVGFSGRLVESRGRFRHAAGRERRFQTRSPQTRKLAATYCSSRGRSVTIPGSFLFASS